jgi:DNA 3'-phosphatase
MSGNNIIEQKWVQVDSTFEYFICNKCIPSKFAFFDLDGTLITSASGKDPKYRVTDVNDWIYLGNIIETLKFYVEKNYTIVIVTNQSHLNQKGGEIIQQKLNSILENLMQQGLCPIFLVSSGTAKDKYRKPNIGTLEYLLNIFNLNEIPHQSFMVGDAAYTYELEGKFPPYDWGDADIKFAENAGLPFYRPNQIFRSNIDNNLIEDLGKFDIIITVGNQGSGKSTLSRLISENKKFIILQSDVLKTKLVKKYLDLLNCGEINIIIDSTNPSQEKRNLFVLPALEKNLSVVVVWNIRDGRAWNNLRIEGKVPSIAYNIYSKNFENPELDDLYLQNKIKVIRVY